jgi:hypothetical protein
MEQREFSPFNQIKVRKGVVRDVNGTVRVLTIQTNICEKRVVSAFHGTARVIPIH